MLLFLIFQNIRNVILLYIMAANYTFFLEVEELLSRHMTNLIWKGFGPGSSQFLLHQSVRKAKNNCQFNVLKSTIINLDKTQEYVIIYQELNLKPIDYTSAKAGEVLNAGSTGEMEGIKHRVMNLYICQTGISGVYLLVSRKV